MRTRPVRTASREDAGTFLRPAPDCAALLVIQTSGAARRPSYLRCGMAARRCSRPVAFRPGRLIVPARTPDTQDRTLTLRLPIRQVSHPGRWMTRDVWCSATNQRT